MGKTLDQCTIHTVCALRSDTCQPWANGTIATRRHAIGSPPRAALRGPNLAGDDALGDSCDRSVGVLRHYLQRIECFVGIDVEALHQLAFGLADDVSGVQCGTKLLVTPHQVP